MRSDKIFNTLARVKLPTMREKNSKKTATPAQKGSFVMLKITRGSIREKRLSVKDLESLNPLVRAVNAVMCIFQLWRRLTKERPSWKMEDSPLILRHSYLGRDPLLQKSNKNLQQHNQDLFPTLERFRSSG